MDLLSWFYLFNGNCCRTNRYSRDSCCQRPSNNTITSAYILNFNLVKNSVRRVILLRMMMEECSSINVIRIRQGRLTITLHVFASRFRFITLSMCNRISHRNRHFRSICFFVNSNRYTKIYCFSRRKSFMIYRTCVRGKIFLSVNFRFFLCRIFHLTFNRATSIRYTRSQRVGIPIVICRVLLRK